MTTTNERMTRFSDDVAGLKLKTNTRTTERLAQMSGLALMVAGIALAVVAYATSLGVQATPGSNIDLLDANSNVILALVGVAMTLAGGFVFLRYSLTRFLRFWLLRQAYEQHLLLEQTRGEAELPTDDG